MPARIRTDLGKQKWIELCAEIERLARLMTPSPEHMLKQVPGEVRHWFLLPDRLDLMVIEDRKCPGQVLHFEASLLGRVIEGKSGNPPRIRFGSLRSWKLDPALSFASELVGWDRASSQEVLDAFMRMISALPSLAPALRQSIESMVAQGKSGHAP